MLHVRFSPGWLGLVDVGMYEDAGVPYLTKARFVTATECPHQAQYATDGRYSDAQTGDEFLEALADDGLSGKAS